MKICNTFLLFAIFFLFVTKSYSQVEKKILKEAQESYIKGDKNNALSLYIRALENNPESAEINFLIGKTFLETIYKTRSLKYLEKAFALNPEVDKQIRYYLGEAYHFSQKFDKALEHFSIFDQSLVEGDPFKVKVTRKIFECNNGKEFVAQPVPAIVTNLGAVVNTPYPEFGPVISADGQTLIFTSRRENSTGQKIDEEGDFYEDIYVARKVKDKWGPAENIGTNINTDGHDASIALSADGKTLFTYDGEGKGNIKYCDLKKDGSWSKPHSLLGRVNSQDSETSICISSDGSTIYFTSDKPGGKGGFDIYMSKLDFRQEWGKPVNLGDVINTPFDEEGPFLDLDGKTLYFSSKAHKGMGSFDLFKSVYDSTSKKWSTPENMGYPINTADDDMYFVLSGDGKHGYYASVREDGSGEKDIYEISMPPRNDYEMLMNKLKSISEKTVNVVIKDTLKKEAPIGIKDANQIKTSKPVLITGAITDMETKSPMSASVQIIDDKGKVVFEQTTSDDGRFNFELNNTKSKKYVLSAQKQGFGFNSRPISAPSPTEQVQELKADLSLQKLEVGHRFVLHNVYFDFDKATFKPESYTELQKLEKLMKDNPSIKIEIGGHTDNKGADQYNKFLSQSRADAVNKYLTGKGIDHSRIAAKGYGEERPIASNDDEAEGRQLNRRIEFEILHQ
ncbi:MAG TPA: OmpA family protein [Cytophagaceae bacterium]|jgi:outer membrane protein OmpA-like peptidoglycan-associated protein